MSGYAAAALAVAICASYPVATRAGVTGPFTPQELVTLRFGVGAMLFLPYLLAQHRAIPRETWLRAVPLTLFQGAGMAALVICGLQWAPANHAAALGPGASPAWVALLGFVLFARRPSARAIAGAALCAAGVLALAGAGVAAMDAAVLAGDLMFLAASALGALYVLQLRRWKVGALPGAALVTLYSALMVVPWHLATAPAAFTRVAPAALAWQVLWQGVLIGCVVLVALNHAISRLGAQRAASVVALVPVLAALLGFAFLGEAPSALELAALVAISAGVSVGAASGAPAATPASLPLAAPPRSARTAGYPVQGNAP